MNSLALDVNHLLN